MAKIGGWKPVSNGKPAFESVSSGFTGSISFEKSGIPGLSSREMNTPLVPIKLTFFESITTRFPWIFPLILTVVAFLLAGRFLNEIGSLTSVGTDENIFTDRNGQVVVISVFEGGASDVAGMKTGDVIIAINGKTFKNSLGADKILKANPPGSIMEYSILRHGVPLTLYVQAANLTFPVRLVASALVTFTCLILGLFIVFQAPLNPGAVLFSFGILLNAYSIGIAFSLSSFVLSFTALSLSAIGIPMLNHSTAWFSGKPELTNSQKRWLFSSYLSGSFIFLVTLRPLSNLFPDFFVKLSLAILIPVFAIINIYAGRLIQPKGAKSLTVAWVIYGVIVSLTIFGNIFQGQLIYFVMFLSLIVPVAYAYEIIRQRIFGIERLLKRNIQYYLIMTVVVIGLIILFYNLSHILTGLSLGETAFRWTPTSLEVRFNGPHPPDFSERPFFILAGVVIFVFTWQAGRIIKNFIAKRYFKDEINYRQAFGIFSEKITGQLKVESLAKTVAEEMVSIMRLKSVWIYLAGDDILVLTASAGEMPDPPAGMLSRSMILSELKENKTITVRRMANHSNLFHSSATILVPLQINKDLIGLIVLGEKQSESWFSSTDIEFAQSLARTAAVAIENARLTEETIESESIRRELDLARNIQQALLPDQVPQCSGLDASGFYLPASEVGGDYYDFLQPAGKPDSLIGIIGDVSGKGISAGLMMTRLQGVLSTIMASGFQDLKSLFSMANRLSGSLNRKSFITLAAVRYHAMEKTIQLCRAGHLPIIRWNSQEKQVEIITPSGLGLGISSPSRFDSAIEMPEYPAVIGDYWILISDGLTDAQNPEGTDFRLSGVQALIEKEIPKNPSAEDLCLKLIGALNAHCETEHPQDDCTLVVFRIS